nr:hypothetical protein [Chenggangzhangella methanolivorans]
MLHEEIAGLHALPGQVLEGARHGERVRAVDAEHRGGVHVDAVRPDGVEEHLVVAVREDLLFRDDVVPGAERAVEVDRDRLALAGLVGHRRADFAERLGDEARVDAVEVHQHRDRLHLAGAFLALSRRRAGERGDVGVAARRCRSSRPRGGARPSWRR